MLFQRGEEEYKQLAISNWKLEKNSVGAGSWDDAHGFNLILVIANFAGAVEWEAGHFPLGQVESWVSRLARRSNSGFGLFGRPEGSGVVSRWGAGRPAAR